MATAKYFTLAADGKTYINKTATAASAGSEDAGKIVALGDDGLLDYSLFPAGIGPDCLSMLASVTMTAGAFVNIFNDAGTAKIRLADASTARPAHGFIKAGVNSAASVNVFPIGPLAGVTTGMTADKTLFLGTAGAVTDAPSLTATYIVQELGRATNATDMMVNIKQPVTIA